MKKQLNKMAFWQSLLSVIVLGIFVLLATGTINELDNFMKYDIKDLGNGVYEETNYHDTEIESITGRRDNKGRWQGPVEFEWKSKDNEDNRLNCIEVVNMVNGLRDGESKTTFVNQPDGLNVIVNKYSMGNLIDKQLKNKGLFSSTADISAFQVLGNKYPWFLLSLNVCGFDGAYIKSYMDTFETKLSAYAFDVTKFNDYYGDVTDELDETPYDSIITLNSQLTMFQGLAAMKNSEFRLAIIDRYLSAGTSTFNIISTTYPGYLHALNDSGIVNQDFKDFCQDMDSRMTSYGALNMQDPFFIDSLDARMFRAINDILNAGKSFSLSEELSVKSIILNSKNYDINDIYDGVIKLLKPSFSKSTPKEVGTIVVNDMLWQYYIPAEIIRQAVMEAYFIKGDVKRIPIATTIFESNNSATSVTLKGYVIEDGGAAVTSRGIAWATFYNPTTNDNKAAPGTGTGSFSATLTGLTPGTTYYARTYATNSAGTAYGNCVSFVANITTGVNEIIKFANDFIVYPNPASEFATFRFLLESSGSIVLNITDINGQLVLEKNLDNLPQGENQIKLNVSGFHNGLYACLLIKGTTKLTCSLIILH
jgi:hypothetical protein